MKILLATHTFYPDVGGLETVARILGEQFADCGHEVVLITQSCAKDPEGDRQFPFSVVRQPGFWKLLALVQWCDVYLQNNISLRTLWPLLLVPRPWVPAHHTWLTRVDGSEGWQDKLKRFLLRFGSPIGVSHAVAVSLDVPGTIVLGNPYNDTLFRVMPEVARRREIVFLARLVSDKGGDLLLEALAELKRVGMTPKLTVVGDGPERENLVRMAAELGIAEQVEFTGVRTGEALVETLNRHRIMVVPSRTPEPFGVVALEGIACGCGMIGSQGGGLSDAIGPCGLTFPNDDKFALMECLRRMLLDDALYDKVRMKAIEHLEKHRPRRVAEAYLRIFEKVA